MTVNKILNTDYFSSIDTEYIIFLWNDYIEAEFEGFGYVAVNDVDIIENLFPVTFDGLRAAFYGNYKPFDEFLQLNKLGNLDSSDDLSDLIDYDELIVYLNENIDYYVQQGYINLNLI